VTAKARLDQPEVLEALGRLAQQGLKTIPRVWLSLDVGQDLLGSPRCMIQFIAQGHRGSDLHKMTCFALLPDEALAIPARPLHRNDIADTHMGIDAPEIR
jgi:hypothetical protein